MPDVWFPGAHIDPGRNAGYNSGRNRMRMVKQHFTAGTNSYGICKNGGLCQWLLPKVGVPWQFAEADAFCFDSGPFNGVGPGIEVERLGTGDYVRPGLQAAEPLTVDQTLWLGRLIWWLSDEWGVPVSLYDGPRYQTGNWHGHANHGDLDDQRSDGLQVEEFEACVGVTTPSPSPTPPAPEDEDDMFVAVYNGQDRDKVGLWIFDGTVIAHYPSVNSLSAGRTFFTENWDDLLWWVDRINETRAAAGIYEYDFGR